MKNTRHNTSLPRRWGIRALTLLLACALMAGLAITASARGDWQGEVVDPATPKPVVTIQGNLVTEKGKPTGFYELALCVRSGRTITDPTGVTGVTPGSVITEADYAAYLAANPDVAKDPSVVFDFQYFPFRTATAAMYVNTDILTAVNWNLQSVTYEAFDAVTGTYPSDAAVAPGAVNYPRGIDTDPAVQGYDPATLPESDAFPNITTPDLNSMSDASRSVALDVENDPRMSTAEGVAEHFADDAALITLSASAPDNYSVILKESTPLVVARFSYDLKRFDTTKVSAALGGVTAQRNSITGDPGAGEEGLWMGWDKTTGFGDASFSGKQALTWLGQSTGTFDFTDSDELAAATQADQTVWVHMGTNDASAPDTFFYYYLAAETDPATDTGDVKIYDKATGTTQTVKNVALPDTAGFKVLTQGTQRNPAATPTADYTYFRNLLSLGEETLVVKLVNEPTFKKPTGAGGKTILFYDWDNTLIGSMTVDKGDVRAEVEAYIEENLVHPDLRPGSTFMDDGAGNTDVNKLSSLERQYTYRGKYAYTVGGDDATLGVTDGKEYPLTNKLDYVFTKRVNTVLTQEESGEKVQYVHPYALNDPALDPTVRDNDAAEYPYVYGWAVVEDTRAFNGNVNAVGGATGPWKVMHDAAKIQGDNDVWTTIGVGELTNSKPTNALNTVAAVDPAAVRTAPAFLAGADVAWTDGTLGDDYAYTVAGESSYLRFADFSDITAEFNRYEGKDTLIVKAVYEPGPELFVGGQYQMVSEPYYNKFSNPAAAKGGAYSVEVTLERATIQRGPIQGVDRARLPAVRQDTTIDQKWIADATLGVDHDLDNADIQTAKALTETTFTKVDTDNGEEITFQLSLSARQNKVDYYLIETYGNNFVSGTTKSLTNYDREGSAHAIDNYNYYTDDSDTNDLYFDVTKYDERDGSHGYVLYGTLNYLMKQATRAKQGEIIQDDFSRGAGFEVLLDANLRTDTSGTQPTAASAILVMQPKILDAAKECIANPTADTWNFEKDCAELSYHQLQYYILGDSVWSDRGLADAKPIAWCHLHASCAAAVSGKPKDWSELVAYAKDATKADGIGELLPGEIETLFGLRKANGNQYSAGSEFKTDVVAAVGAGCESWAEIQYYIVHKAAPADAAAALAEAKTTYWWYNKATSAPGTPGNLTALVKSTDEYFTEVTLPDGTKESGWTTALERGKKNFDANDDGDNSTVDRGWKNMTQNLVAKWIIETGPGGNPTGVESTEKFADWDSFKSELLRVVTIARTAGATPATDSDYWYKAQYLIIHPDETAWPTVAVGDGTTEGDEMAGYWWHNGGTHLFINDLPSMLSVAGLVNDGDEAAKGVWDRFKLTDFQKCDDMTDFALSFNSVDKIDNMEIDGITTNANEFSDFKDKILALNKFAANNTWFDLDNSTNANLWKDVQFWLLHVESEVKPGEAAKEYSYYWWEDNGTPSPITPAGVAGNVRSWLNIAFMDVYNGNTVAWDNVTANNADGVSNNAFNATRLRNPAAEDVTAGNTKYQHVDDIPLLSAADVKTKMNALIVEMMAGKTGHAAHTPPVRATWYQVQDYLITGVYTDKPTSEQTAAWEKQYWWLEQDENPDKPVEPPQTEALDQFIADFLYPTNNVASITLDALKGTENPTDPTDDSKLLSFYRTSAGPFAGRALSTAKTRLNALLTAAAAEGQDLSTLTWYQIQWALLDEGNGAYLTPNQAYRQLKDTATWAPSWVKKLPEPPAPEALDYFAATFLQSASAVDSVTLNDLAGSTKGDLTFYRTSSGPFAGRALSTAKTRLKALIADPGVAAQGGASTLTWYQIQYALIDEGNGAYKTPLDAYTWGKDLCTWAPACATTAAVPEGASLSALGELVLDELSDLGELVEDGDVGTAVPSGPEADTDPKNDLTDTTTDTDTDTKNDLPNTTTTTKVLPDGGVLVTTVVTGADGYVTTVVTHITPGGVAATTTTITPPAQEDAPADEDAGAVEDVGAAVPSGPKAPAQPTAPEPEPDQPSAGGDAPAEPDQPADENAETDVPTPAPERDVYDERPETPLGEDAASALNTARLSTLPRRYAPPSVEAVWKKWWLAV